MSLLAALLLLSGAPLLGGAAFAQNVDDDFLFEDEGEIAEETDAGEDEQGEAADPTAAAEDEEGKARLIEEGDVPSPETARKHRGIEELTVTGRKRDEMLQEVPNSIRAFGAGEIEQRNMQRIDDIGLATANLQFTGANGSSRDTRIYIRGIGQADTRNILDPGVGLYIDNVYIPRATNALIDLVDLERIDVLRGPQGTLFGKNTVGGLINIISAKPAQEFGGQARVSVGSFDLLETRFTLDVPITAGWFDEKLYTRWTIATATDDGYLTNVFDDGVSGDNKLLAGRFAATLLATEGLTLNTAFDWQQSNENAMVGRCKISGQDSATLSDDGTRASYGPYVIARYIADNFGNLDGSPDAPGYVPGQEYRFPEACAATDALGRFDGYANPLARLRETSYGLSNNLDWALAESWQPKWLTTDVRNVFGFRLRDQDNGAADFDGTAIEYVTLGSHPARHYAISDDVTATMGIDTGSPDIGMRLIVGAFGFYEKETNGGYSDINRNMALGLDPAFNIETWNAVTGGVPAFNGLYRDALRYGSGQLNVDTTQQWDTISVAGYAHVEFELFEDWSVTGGLRYSWEKKERGGDRYGLLCPGGPLGVPPTQECLPGDTPEETVIRDQSATWQRATPEAGAQYRINDDQMTYFRYAQGWKSGGFNREALTERRDDWTDVNMVSDQFEPEIVNAYEIGFKSTWFDNQLLFNAALFWNDYQNLQITAIEPDENGLVSANITNAADAITRGFELEATSIPDWDWLPGPDAEFVLTGGFGFTDAYYKEYTADVANSPYPVKVECTSLKRVQGADPDDCNGEIDRFVQGVINQSILQIDTGSTPVDRSDNQFANVPKLNFNISALYAFTLLDDLTIVTNLRYYYQTDIYFNTDNSPNLFQPGYGLLDGSIGFTYQPTDTRIEVWAKNLTDQEYFQGGFSFGPAFGADGVYVARPRTFGMTLTQPF